jgi:hypothetical protein
VTGNCPLRNPKLAWREIEGEIVIIRSSFVEGNWSGIGGLVCPLFATFDPYLKGSPMGMGLAWEVKLAESSSMLLNKA